MDPLMMFDCQPESHYPLVHPAAEFSHSVIHNESHVIAEFRYCAIGLRPQ